MIQENISLRPYNTFGIDVNARYFAAVSSVEDLKTVLGHKSYTNERKLILGGGSNVLLLDHFPGLVIHPEITGITVEDEDEQHVWISAGAGENWHRFVLHCIDQGYGGIENLSLIPGNVGAAPMQNIGAYGVELKDVFEELEAVEVSSGEKHIFSYDDCEFDYRYSVFKGPLKDKYIITKVTLKLSKQPEVNTSYGAIQRTLDEKGITNPGIREVSNAVIQIRQSKLPDPAVTGNAGSFFKNAIVTQEKFNALQEQYPDMPHYPLADGQVKVPSGWLIEQCGWKGKSYGHYGVNPSQALVLVNYGGATGEEIYELAQAIKRNVEAKFRVVLEEEVNIIK